MRMDRKDTRKFGRRIGKMPDVLSRKELDELKKKIEPVKKLAMHDDADGITSGVLLSYVLNIKKVWSPEDFGEWPIKPYQENGEQEIPPDVCVDMVPANVEWEGLAFDHHPGHPPEGKRKYQLIWGDVPASVVIYRLFRNFIPKDQRWKVAVGAVGDGQAEVIPPDVWREHPVLLEEALSTWEKFGKIETSSLPLYMRLSSGINAACKIPEKWYVGYSVLRNARSPWDLLKDSSLKTAKDYMADEHAKILRESNPIRLRNGIMFWPFSSETKIERTLAWELWEKEKKTVVVINTKTGRGSIRGILATLVFEHLSMNDFKASGHPGFGGVRLKQTQKWEDLYACLSGFKF